MLVLVKLASQSGMHLAEILFWRQLPTVPIVAGFFLLRGQPRRLVTHRPKVHAKRAIYGLLGMFLNFGAVTLLPLAEATTFNFTSAIWAVILSAMVLKETVGRYRWAAVALGFAGVVVMTQPGHSHVPLFGAAVALGAAFMIAMISIQIRDLSRTDEPIIIVFYFALFTLPVLVLFLPFVGQWHHTSYQWSLLLGLGLSGILGQFLLTSALRLGAVSSVIVMDYSGLIWATLFGWLVFASLPPASTWIGAPLIVAAGLIIAYREHKLSIERQDTVPPGGV